jgi:hypothetical protein
MQPIMRRASIAAVAIGAWLLPAPGAWAQAARTALVVGNGNYNSLPAVPGCARSANVVSAALRALGFEVTERQDASTGALDAGITEFSQNLATRKGTAFVYVCGYGTDFNDRTFLLPTTARITRPSDVLTQGVLAKSLLATVSRDPANVAVVVFDLVPKPDGPARMELDALVSLPVPDGVGVMAVNETSLVDGPTPLAAAVVTALAGPLVRTEGFLAGVQARLAGSTVGAASLHVPVRPGVLVGPSPAAEPLAPPPAVAVTTPIPPPAGVPPPTPSEAAIPPDLIPDEAQMTEVDRRKVQGALVRLGYYNSLVDGQFGPETRAAIRRYQHEISGEMTGRLTSAQASKLVNTR